MNFTEVTSKINELSSNWEQFKVINDRRLKEIEKKGISDPLTDNHLSKLNDQLDLQKDSLNKIEAALSRPSLDSKGYENLANSDHRQAFVNYLRKGIDVDLINLEKKSISQSSDRDGGYIVSSRMHAQIEQQLSELSPMRKIASVIEISSDSLELIEDRMEALAGWTQEAQDYNETSSPQITKKIIPTHELYAQPKVTQKLIDDSKIDLEAWLSNKLIDVFTRKENAAFIHGDGNGKPRGILSYEEGKEWGKIEQINSEADGKITAEGLIKLFFSLKEIYAVKGKFLMGRDSVQAVRMLKDTNNGKYLWQPGLDAKNPDTLLGAEVIQAADMPAIATDSLSVAYADFGKAYQIVDRQNVRILRDPFTNKPFVKFYTTKRVGGDVVNFDAIKLLKLSA